MCIPAVGKQLRDQVHKLRLHVSYVCNLHDQHLLALRVCQPRQLQETVHLQVLLLSCTGAPTGMMLVLLKKCSAACLTALHFPALVRTDCQFCIEP